MIVLTFRGRTLEVSGQVIKTFQEMEITREANVKEQEGDAGDGKPKVNYAKVEGIKADNMSFEVLLLQVAGVDVMEEMQGWRQLVDGQRARLYLAGTDILETDVTLTGCDASQIMLDGAGGFSQAKLKLTFTQAGAVKVKKTGVVKKKGGDLNWEAVNRYDALTKGVRDNGKTFQSVFTSPPKN
jgi:hypothetical protein